MTHPYRVPAPRTSLRWGVTLRAKLYVRIMRYFIDIRAPYRYRREYLQYARNLYQWKLLEAAHKRSLEWGEYQTNGCWSLRFRNPLKLPPKPLPPPRPVRE